MSLLKYQARIKTMNNGKSPSKSTMTAKAVARIQSAEDRKPGGQTRPGGHKPRAQRAVAKNKS